MDLEQRLIIHEKTKTEEWTERHLTAHLVARIAALNVKDDERVFGYTDRQAVNRRIKAVCRRAGIEPRSSHAAGRHTFATNAMDMGAGVKDAMEAGGWKSAALFMQTYVHSREAGRKVAGIFDRQTGPIDIKMAESITRKKLRFGKKT